MGGDRGDLGGQAKIHKPPPSQLAFVPEWVAQQFYRHGLFCASQPLAVLVFAFIGIMWSCFPLFTIQVYSGDAKVWVEPLESVAESEKPRWLDRQPVGYVQQVVMKAAVHPYTEDLLRNDAFRGPLATSFKLHLADVAGFSDRGGTGLDMDHECMRTDGLSPRYRASLAQLLPDYGCLVLSPANIWRKDPTTFQEDANIVDTVFNFQRSREGHSSLADIMFGLRQRDTGLTKYPVNNRQRTISYSVTVVLRQHKPHFIAALKKHLQTLYPLHAGEEGDVNSTTDGRIVHIHFLEQFNGAEYVPYTVTIVMFFFYVYYSTRKIELIQSKVGIALTAVFTILGSLFMSLGLTGLSLGGSGYIYLVPYLVAALGLENVLVVTRSVVSTPAHLDVKVRVAQGLSKEGWNITKNLFSEITVLTLGFFIGIVDSSIQDFCLLAVSGVLTDFYLQTFFFLTILSMDISRTRLVDRVQDGRGGTTSYPPGFQHPVSGPGIRLVEREGEGLVAPQPRHKLCVPRRVQVFNFWAQQRVVSRLFVAAMVGWLCLFIYQTKMVETLMRGAGWVPVSSQQDNEMEHLTNLHSGAFFSAIQRDKVGSPDKLASIISDHGGQTEAPEMLTRNMRRLLHRDTDYWRRLPYSHWPMLFGLYNMSVYGSRVVLLPPILLSMVVPPEAVIKFRSPHEKARVGDHPVWSLEKIRSALETGEGEDDLLDELVGLEDSLTLDGPELSPFVPTSPGELLLAFALAVPSLLFLVYLSVVCYRFMCTKNYAEWRTAGGWLGVVGEDQYTQIVQEGAPLSLSGGHLQDIESIATDGHLILSVCLEGRLVVWDSLTGDTLASLNRMQKKDPDMAGEQSADVSHLLPNTDKPKFTSRKAEILSRKSKSETFRKFSDKFLVGLEVEPEICPQPSPSLDSLPTETLSTVWAVDLAEGLVMVATQTGQVEMWDYSEGGVGSLKAFWHDGKNNPISHIRLLAGRVILARLDGTIDFLEIVSVGVMRTDSSSPSKSRMRLISTTSSDSLPGWVGEELRLAWRSTAKAHLQAITCLTVQPGTKLLTGSQDHTIRVFRADDGVGVYTLHGHCGPISSVFIDRLTPSTAGSASLDGLLCVWDLLTGACMYSIQAHRGAVRALAYSPSYVVSLGEDQRLCVWERGQGHLINCMETATVMGDSDCQDLVMLTHNLMVTAKNGFLIVWDARLTEPVKLVRLGRSDQGAASVKLIRKIGDTIVCSLGNQVRLVRFPMLSEKMD